MPPTTGQSLVPVRTPSPSRSSLSRIVVNEPISIPGPTGSVHALLAIARPAALTLLMLGAVLHVGMQYGRSNHCQYLLHGRHAADSAFLQTDWFTTETPSHHPAFDRFVACAHRTGRAPILLGLANAAMTLAFALSLWLIIARCTATPILPFAAALVTSANLGPACLGHSHILLPYFVPSVFAGVALLAAMAAYLHDRPLAAGLIAALGCAFHANYAALVGPLWVATLLLDHRPGRGPRAVRLLAPWLAAWAPHLPYLITLLADSEHGEAARRVFFDIYAPAHYRPATWPARHWLDAAAPAAGAVLILALRPRAWPCAAGVLAGALLLGVAAAVVFTLLFPVDFVTSAFPWRLAPFLSVACLIVLSATSATDDLAGPVRRLLSIGIAIASVIVARMPGWVVIAFSIALAAPLMASLIARMHSGRSGAALAAAIPIVAALYAGADLFRHGLWRRDAFGEPYKPHLETLFAWCRNHTECDARFAIPPDLAPFRLETGRAVIADWKCMPLMPSHQLEWLRRQERLAGGPVGSQQAAIDGFSTADAARVRGWAREFGCRYVVIDRQRHQADLTGLRAVFSTDHHAVLQIDR